MILNCLNDPYIDIPQFDEDNVLIETKVVRIGTDQIITKISVEPELILVHKQDFDNTGKVYTDRCLANIQGFGTVILLHTFDEIELIKNRVRQNHLIGGFKDRSNG